MVYIYALPGFNFVHPEINNLLLKGYLKNKNIKSISIDLGIEFVKECLNYKYISNNILPDYYNISTKEKQTIINVENYIKNIKNKHSSTEQILYNNHKFLECLKIFSKYYDILWNNKGMFFSKNINTIDDLKNLLISKKINIFDYIFNIELNKIKSGYVYLCVSYDFQLPFAIRFANMIKKKDSNIKVIFGGNYITHIMKNCYLLMKEFECIDSIVFFGYHNNFYNVYNYFEKNHTIDVINSMIRNKDGHIVKNDIKDSFFEDKKNFIPDFSDVEFDQYLSKERIIPMILNYGCYYRKCKFCAHCYYFNGYHDLDLNSIFKVIKDEYIKDKIKIINFVDECIHPKIILQLSEFLIKNNIKINWLMETRIDNEYLNEKTIKTIYSAGCRLISFGIESNSQKVVDDMNKGINLITAKKVLKKVYCSGILTFATFIIGYPTEKRIETYKTLIFIKNFKYIDSFGLSIFNYARNSILSERINVEPNDIKLVLNSNDINKVKLYILLQKFYKINKIKSFLKIRENVLNRSEYLLFDRNIISLNYNMSKEKRCSNGK